MDLRELTEIRELAGTNAKLAVLLAVGVTNECHLVERRVECCALTQVNFLVCLVLSFHQHGHLRSMHATFCGWCCVSALQPTQNAQSCFFEARWGSGWFTTFIPSVSVMEDIMIDAINDHSEAESPEVDVVSECRASGCCGRLFKGPLHCYYGGEPDQLQGRVGRATNRREHPKGRNPCDVTVRYVPKGLTTAAAAAITRPRKVAPSIRATMSGQQLFAYRPHHHRVQTT
jgi:hypothetical protein